VELTRVARIALAGLVALALIAVPAASSAERLSMAKARERAESFATSTCNHDKSCASSGVQVCRRHSDRIVLCRIYDHRKTEDQGNFLCTRLVRLALQPSTGRIPVTGVGNWEC
jgi:hypothetical protein